MPTVTRRSMHQVSSRFRSVPLLYKVLTANVAVVVFGAIAGTYITAITFRDSSGPSRAGLVLVYVVIGVVLSVIVNLLALRAAFQPLRTLEQLAIQVRKGDLSARADPGPLTDPQISRLIETFNATLSELERDQARLRELANKVIDAQEGERMRVARELHDDTAQVLFAQLLRIAALKSSPDDDVRAMAAALEPLTVSAIEGVRRLALELRPPALDDLGLREALGDLAQRFGENIGISVDLSTTGIRDRLDPEVELVLYRIAQEALTNVGKHAKARHVWISLDRQVEKVTLTIDDDGVGIRHRGRMLRDVSGLGLGIFGMVERAVLVGGTLSVNAREPAGTRVRAHVPLGLSALASTDDTSAKAVS